MPAATPYDQILYPSATFRKCHPDLLGTIARLHGIDAPSPATARFLEVGGGDGLNATAVAAEFPGSHCVNFDIATVPVERGRRWAEQAGLANARHYVLDIMEAAERLEGPFDYIIAHGIYAWVPPAVAAAVVAMMGRLLSPTGVAFISYNALPGGHSRRGLREMLLHRIRPIESPAERIAAARTILQGFAAPQDKDLPIITAMRRDAEAALAKSDGLLFHDELNPFYEPHYLSDVVAVARREGLAYLGDTGPGGMDMGFLDPERAGMGEEAWLDALQGLDHTRGRYFRSSLFVRQGLDISRTIVAEAARPLWASSRAVPLGDSRFRLGKVELRIGDPAIAALIERLAAAAAGRLPVRELVPEGQDLMPLCQRVVEGYVDLHLAPAPFTLAPGAHPVASPLARVQVEDGEPRITTLDHLTIAPPDSVRRLLPLLDGTRDRAAVTRDFGEDAGPHIDRAARLALLSA